MFNKVILIGNLGQDPEFKSTGSSQFASFPLATHTAWHDKRRGEKQDRTEWHRIVAWGKLAQTCRQHLEKGKMILVEGALKTTAINVGKSEDGVERLAYVTEVVASRIKIFPRAENQGGKK